MRTLLLAFCSSAIVWAASSTTALDRYVAAPDSSYKWEIAARKEVAGAAVTVLDMTSQTWLSADKVDRPVWKHWLTVIRPKAVKSGIALLFITGGANGRPAPEKPDAMLLSIANETGMVVGELRNVPNQPLRFLDDPAGRNRTEDALIAYTWDKYLRTGDAAWPARLPMTKAAVRAMDTITAFARTTEGGGLTIDRFAVAGASKRGWTTWTTAAADKRVVAIAPMVIDLLNIVPSFIHHWRAYGFWAPAIQDYTDAHIMSWMGTRQYKDLMKIEEPFEYRDRLTMPKLILNASGDDFFLPDSSQFYFDRLRGEKHLRYVPNTRHNLSPSDVPQSLTAFLTSVVENRPRPDFRFRSRKDGRIEVTDFAGPAGTPKEVLLWQITNPKARDFRLTTTGPNWKSTPLSPVKGKYVGSVPKPAAGYTAFFIELTYDSGMKFPHKFTTGVKVVPDTYPFPPPKPGDGLAKK
ncbi:MAG: PhoPQ-activated pathogenicity-related family protein [Bryobacterales bacterium]|nr:PhoPQ-activated pathogenicity-related family protein [Bryobacterales bacterium]